MTSKKLTAYGLGLAAFSLLVTQGSLGCTVCFNGGGPDGAATRAALDGAIFCLLGFIGGVLGGIAAFIFYLRKRASMAWNPASVRSRRRGPHSATVSPLPRFQPPSFAEHKTHGVHRTNFTPMTRP